MKSAILGFIAVDLCVLAEIFSNPSWGKGENFLILSTSILLWLYAILIWFASYSKIEKSERPSDKFFYRLGLVNVWGAAIIIGGSFLLELLKEIFHIH